ncbi:hypothetical protein ACVWZA_003404 [Sphingomonas sp. UYAg733]
MSALADLNSYYTSFPARAGEAVTGKGPPAVISRS